MEKEENLEEVEEVSEAQEKPKKKKGEKGKKKEKGYVVLSRISCNGKVFEPGDSFEGHGLKDKGLQALVEAKALEIS